MNEKENMDVIDLGESIRPEIEVMIEEIAWLAQALRGLLIEEGE